ncbi:hypothetical protein OS242_11000 [Tumebacillus sp. DT12]|uniref:Uncharacterized protein n=1 Tax=Tumebacillus lacus TaxID=2995335 RepID=A0ABT3X0Q0_9BACL|nr:hypothetical protein [Tumebacillus lacus]MCX7570489.1 hypothetical protein [Tumebacillus lacus]
MKINSIMKQYIDSMDIDSMKNLAIDFTRVESIIFPKFFEWDGCVLLSQQRDKALPTHFLPSQFVPDRTAFEADYNHIHLNDFFDECSNFNALLSVGIKMLEVWAAVLHKQYIGRRKFMLILSCDDEEVVLRFYVVRENEAPWLDTSKLDSYLDGLVIIEI